MSPSLDGFLARTDQMQVGEMNAMGDPFGAGRIESGTGADNLNRLP
jgi:hypothetical protein